MQENILAVLIGEPNQMGNGAFDTGQRALLSVTGGYTSVSSYTFTGNSLYLLYYDVGQFDPQDAFVYFCRQFYNKPFTWFQLSAPPPNPLFQASNIYLVPMAPPPEPVGSGTMVLIDSGYDPLKGFYLTFEGSYDLTCPIFRNYAGMNRDNPNYQIRIG